MIVLFLHGWQSVPGGVKPSYLAQHGHEVINPKLPDEDFAEAVRIAQAEYDRHRPQAVVGSSQGGAVAMNINGGNARLVLLCPAWRKHGTARTVKPGTVILHARADDVVPFGYSEECIVSLPLVTVHSQHQADDRSQRRRPGLGWSQRRLRPVERTDALAHLPAPGEEVCTRYRPFAVNHTALPRKNFDAPKENRLSQVRPAVASRSLAVPALEGVQHDLQRLLVRRLDQMVVEPRFRRAAAVLPLPPAGQ